MNSYQLTYSTTRYGLYEVVSAELKKTNGKESLLLVQVKSSQPLPQTEMYSIIPLLISPLSPLIVKEEPPNPMLSAICFLYKKDIA